MNKLPTPSLELQSLPRCQQDLQAMKTIPGGRLCASCQKCIVDFRDASPEKIARIHAFSPEPVCGFYTPEQLAGQPTKPRQTNKKPWWVVAAFLAFFWTRPEQLKTQVPITVPVEHHPFGQKEQLADQKEGRSTPVVQDSFSIRGKVVDLHTGEPLIFANVFIDSWGWGQSTDLEGGFEFLLPLDEAGQTITLGVSYVGYASTQVVLQVPPATIVKGNPVVQVEPIKVESGALIAYGVEVPSAPKRIWRKMTSPLRRFWHVVFN